MKIIRVGCSLLTAVFIFGACSTPATRESSVDRSEDLAYVTDAGVRVGFSEVTYARDNRKRLLSWLYGQGRLTPEVLKEGRRLREEVYPSRSYSEDCLRVEAILEKRAKSIKAECEYYRNVFLGH